MTRRALVLCAAVLAACDGQRPGAGPWVEMFDGRSLAGWSATIFGGEGDVHVDDGAMILDWGGPMTGVTWEGEFPTADYEIALEAARMDGSDFFCGLTFPVGDDCLTLVLGGWGGALCGLSCLDGQDASDNETMRILKLDDRRFYDVRVTVRGARVTARLDGEVIADVDTSEHRLSLRPEVEPCRPLGIASFETVAAIRAIRYRRL